MKTWCHGLAIGLILVVSGAAQAVPPTLVVPPLPPALYPVAPPAAPTPLGPASVPDNTPPGLRGCLNRHGLACVSHHTWFGCGNFRSEMTFIFGSCRTFFGEACIPRDPNANAAGANGEGQRRNSIFGRLRGCSSCEQ